MARAVKDIEQDIRALSAEDKVALLRVLIAELDTSPDPAVERAWLEESERRLAEIDAGTAKTVPGCEVLDEARLR